MGEEIRLLTELTSQVGDLHLQVGELHGKMDLVINRLDRINGRLDQHDRWIANHEALHATGQGENQVRRRIWDFAWRLVGPVVGALTGYLLARAPRLAQAMLAIKGVMRE